MKVAIYCRVSREDLNLDNQIKPLVKMCKEKNWEYEVFEEKKSTRKTRPVQNEIYLKALRKEIDGVLVYKFDRWGRDAGQTLMQISDIMKKGVKFISYQEAFDLETSHGLAMAQVILIFSEYERNIIRERTIAGLDRVRAQGQG